jgi:hypothetical protein
MIAAIWKALAAFLIAYVLAVSSVADFLAHQCGRYWFDYTFQLSLDRAPLAIFVILGVIVFLFNMIRPLGNAVHWWFWLAFAVVVLVGNSAFAQTAPPGQTDAAGRTVQCALRS